ncbi:MAG: winged helix-turn-helix transcriptional regulator [Chloroflexi bacterium]|nr:winged helix-turn-helix transcriptional regulator [Chloroflexota bacterium]MDA1239835.1 winged helix-turn-helix transcriptional regulator [Chloroflexota bacterium]
MATAKPASVTDEDVPGYDVLSAFCPRFQHAVELIGRRWTGAILRAMLAGGHRFSDIAATVPDLSDRLLSERLKELEAEGLLRREVYPETPVRIEYHLTEKGRSLWPVVESLSDWAERWLPLEPEATAAAPTR